jgi:putative radical SAM enzyme (TIGR03279 family)
MLKITAIEPGSPALKAGIAVGDELLSINRHSIDDQLDYQFHQADYSVTLKLVRQGKAISKRINKAIDSDLGLSFQPDRIIRCRNNCVFCFVHNNPKGMRQPLYVKDDDYRLSFIHGNFVTMTNVSESEIERIIKLRLSPLYISVQATDEATRQLLFSRKQIPPILPLLRRFAENKISFHSQVVVVPGYNDGPILDKTAAELAKLRPYALSLAVVPVGLTRYSRTAIGDGGKVIPVSAALSKKLIQQVECLRVKYRDSDNKFAYAADELFIRSGIDIPAARYYDDYPQIENGVGLARQFMDSIPRTISQKKKRDLAEKGIWVTGRSMEHIWKKYIFPKHGFTLNLLVVVNGLFGSKVTVSGLLAGKDILRKLKQMNPRSGPVIIPPNCLNDNDKFIDDFTPQELADRTGLDVIQGTYDFGETIRYII